MNIETSALGVLNIKDEQIYHFQKGLPGFEQETEFAVIDLKEGEFSYLQSLKTEELAFLLTDPFVFFPHYEFELPEPEAEELEIQQSVVVRAIVTLRETLDESTLNLLAPIVFNPDNNSGKQVVLHNTAYSTRQLLWTQGSTKGEPSC